MSEKEVVFHSVVTQVNSSSWLKIGDGGGTYFRYPGYSQEECLLLGLMRKGKFVLIISPL